MENRNLPSLLSADGTWDASRREEILGLFETTVFGVMPKDGYTQNHWCSAKKKLPNGLGTQEIHTVQITTDKGTLEYPVFLYLPAKALEGTRVPLALYVGNRPRKDQPITMPPNLPAQVLSALMKEMKAASGNNAPQNAAPQPPVVKACDLENALELDNWPVAQLLQEGIATAAYYTEDLEPDYCTDLKQGILRLFDPEDGRKNDSWGAIGAWAFGASRALDCLLEDARIDTAHIAVVGHSRGGKTALWCAATDKRVTCAYANNSGCTGAALSRGKQGEKLLQINTFFPYWFCDAYKAYNGREDELPLDQHMLIALSAPRKVYVASATEDSWADPASEFAGAFAAAPAWECQGKKGIGCDSLPLPDTFNHDGYIGYHTRTGAHNLTAWDWATFTKFWAKSF